jgi:hypothetical protein
VGDPRCGPALIGLLDSDNPTVREWAAITLANLEIEGAVEPLRRAYRACLDRATPPDWTEPDGIRWALTELGGRSPAVPSLTARLRAETGDSSPGWPSAHFTTIIIEVVSPESAHRDRTVNPVVGGREDRAALPTLPGARTPPCASA